MIDNIYLIDTDTLSYILKRLEPAYSNSQAYLHNHAKFGISSITYISHAVVLISLKSR